jgi:DNA-binding Lrp family transcriptional regulator
VSIPPPGGSPADDLHIDEVTLSLEHLYDQFLDPHGRFTFERDVEFPEGVALDMTIGELLMESLRLLDEWPRINEAYANDSSRLSPHEPEATSPLTPAQQAVLLCARGGLSLSDARMRLGISRPALLRRVDELRALGYIEVGGVPGGEDLSARLIGQARRLLEAEQFDEAAHVFGALLATDPSAASVRRLLEEAEREQLAFLRHRVPAASIPVQNSRVLDRTMLTLSERAVLDRVNGRWDVGVIVLMSPLRETETLKSIQKLVRIGLLRLALPAGVKPNDAPVR